jgi:hypothetical protein
MTFRGPKTTLAKLVSLVEIELQDQSNVRWQQTEIEAMIRQAIRATRGKWFEERRDDTLTYASGTLRYALPPCCWQVYEVRFESLTENKPEYVVPMRDWTMDADGYLNFTHDFTNYNGQSIYLYYTVLPYNLLTCTNTNGVVATSDPDALTSVGATFITSGVEVGDTVEIIGQGEFYVESVDSETQLTLHKAPTAGTSLTYHVARYTDLPERYIVCKTKAYLLEMAAQAHPDVEMQAVAEWANFYHQMAAFELDNAPKPFPHVMRQKAYGHEN